MALVLVVAKSSISADCGTLTVIDNTGDYNVTTNPTGLGAPNETRANLYYKFFLTLKKSTGDEDIDIDAYNENTVSSWAITITEDGWYEAYLFACLAWSSGTTFAINNITYHAGSDTFYKSLQNGNTNNAVTDAAWWEETTDIDDFKAAIALPQTNTYAASKDIVELCNSRVCKSRAFLNYDCKCGGGCKCNDKYDEIRLLIDGADINGSAAVGAYSRAQAIIETIQNKCNCIEDTDA